MTRGRLRLLKRAIAAYLAQTLPERELLILAQGDARYRQALVDHLRHLDRADIRLRFCDDQLNLGQLRNLSLDDAAGELVCQWDDDDGYHPERLARQVEHLEREQAAACFLTDHLQLVEPERAVHWIDWTAGEPGPRSKWSYAPGTLLMRADPRFRYPERGETARLGEDSVLLDALDGVVPIAGLSDAGHLYVYSFHGRNTYPAEHHGRFRWWHKPAGFVRSRERELRAALASHPAPRPLRVYAGDEVAFVIDR